MIAGTAEVWRPLSPAAEDVARIPAEVREHALVMRRLSLAAREARKRWYDVREQYKRWNEVERPIKSFEVKPLVIATMKMWEAELALEQAAGVFRSQLAENNAAPVGARWSPTVLSLWARQQVQGPEKTTC